MPSQPRIPGLLMGLALILLGGLGVLWLSDRALPLNAAESYPLHTLSFSLGTLVTVGLLERLVALLPPGFRRHQLWAEVALILALSGFAGWTEYYQATQQTHHEADPWDWGADLLGVAFGMTLYWGLGLWATYRARRHPPNPH